MDWIAASMPPLAEGSGSLVGQVLRVYGWSGGYVAFRSIMSEATGRSTIFTASSADGLRWKDGGPLAMPAGGAAWILSVVEGPAGLLAIGSGGDACGSPSPISGIWRSSDGVAWQEVDVAGVFGGGLVYRIDAGSAGYIATGSVGASAATAAVWTSADGVSWKPVDLAAQTFAGIQVQNGTAFSGGFVIAGSVLVPSEDGCGSVYNTPSLWWSRDGRTWSQDTVPGVAPGTTASMYVMRISDHALLAIERSQTGYSATSATWTSTDGQTWKPFSEPPVAGVLTNGRRGLFIAEPVINAEGNPTGLEVDAIQDDLTVTRLTLRGDLPDQLAWANVSILVTVAFGPTGLLVVDYAGRIWIGVPAAA